MKLQMTAPCHFGLEKTLAFEIKRSGGENLNITDGRVNFTGSAEVLIRANISCAVAERIGVVLARFKANSFDDVFDNIKSLKIGEFLPLDGGFPVVKGQSVNSKLTSIPALQRTVKKALAEAMSRHYKTKSLPETGAVYPVRFFLHKDEMTVFLDSSGEGLHKRGYREKSGAAPIKETLAAGIIDIAKVRENDLIADPFCGSGTMLIEAAFKALNFPPCLNRNFTAENWDFIPRELWREQREALRAGIKKDVEFKAVGYDIDENCVKLTLENAKKAGVSEYIRAEKRAVKDFQSASPFIIITNPPYGRRLGDAETAEKTYSDMGKLARNFPGWKLVLITDNPGFESFFGKKADACREITNGAICSYLYQYEKL